jgi:hypothetical protein
MGERGRRPQLVQCHRERESWTTWPTYSLTRVKIIDPLSFYNLANLANFLSQGRVGHLVANLGHPFEPGTVRLLTLRHLDRRTAGSRSTRSHARPRTTSKIAAAAKAAKGGFRSDRRHSLKDTYDRPIRNRRNVRCHKRKFQSCDAAQSGEVAVIIEHRRVHALYWLSAIV